ncbi:N-acetyltransferase [Kribbella pittospori]|uniref:N-acetyltransferase n=1 Tax=Kribbella pittospori TaxID=722689 RepID=A0A4R0JV95_9ACTN|nr:GNAT family N-acetyltransferase [Kribbella pittospori]TCC46155.1 N-acetyltransferase [Kribbella pittospori]
MSGNAPPPGQSGPPEDQTAAAMPAAASVPDRQSLDANRVLPVSDLGVTDRSGGIEVVHRELDRFYELLDRGMSVALLVYEQGPDRTAITHAMVREDQRGRGYGTTLIATALPHLAASGGPVVNYCNSVARFLEKHPDFKTFVGSDG